MPAEADPLHHQLHFKPALQMNVCAHSKLFWSLLLSANPSRLAESTSHQLGGADSKACLPRNSAECTLKSSPVPLQLCFHALIVGVFGYDSRKTAFQAKLGPGKLAVLQP